MVSPKTPVESSATSLVEEQLASSSRAGRIGRRGRGVLQGVAAAG